MHLNEMIRINNKRRKKLNPANEKYYTDIQTYIRAAKISRRKTEQLLMETLDTLIKAQAEGRTAIDVFGDDPQAYGEKSIRSLSKVTPFIIFKRYGYIAIIVLTWTFLAHGIIGLLTFIPKFPLQKDAVLNLNLSLGLIVALAVAPLFIAFALDLIKSQFAQEEDKETSRRFRLVFMGFILLLIVLDVTLTWFFPNWDLEVKLMPWYSLLLFAIGFGTYKYLLKNIEI